MVNKSESFGQNAYSLIQTCQGEVFKVPKALQDSKRAIIMPQKGLAMKLKLANTGHAAFTNLAAISRLEGFIFPED